MIDMLPFEMTPEVIHRIRTTQSIPARLFNKDGQTVILPKIGITEAEIQKLLRFTANGLFYLAADREALGITSKPKPEVRVVETAPQPQTVPVYEGATATELISQTQAKQTAVLSQDLLNELKETSLNETRTRAMGEKLGTLFSDFEGQNEAMTGLVNIIEVLGGMSVMPAPQMMVKRTVISMAMKTRGMSIAASRDKAALRSSVTNLMMSSLLCDVGYVRMKPLNSPQLTLEEHQYIKTHPLVSYMLIASDDSLDRQVKTRVLTHHRALPDGQVNNNYPALPWLKERLSQLLDKNHSEETRRALVLDVEHQLSHVERTSQLDEDLHILSLASEFASLTTETSWRGAFTPERAVRMIINNSFFTHADRTVRDFLDNVSVSLCRNKKILKEQDFVIISTIDAEGKSHWEAGRITTSSRWQSRPGVDRIAAVSPVFRKEPKLQIATFKVERSDPRSIHLELANDPHRRLVYAVDPEHDGTLYDTLDRIVRGH